ncbi:MAG TPA: M20/M25/M40 family metallo-hydrolase [Vicinamibacteria bacterium]|nr:M20/M25/M40 family metallo-hydrolase [Vicinamibacteria bacterium]
MKHQLPVLVALCCAAPAMADESADRLVAALLADTPLVSDLAALTDEIGGRPTGSEANRRAVEWGVARFREAGVAVAREAFPAHLWLERSVSVRVSGDVAFAPRAVANPFSIATPPAGITAPLQLAGHGSPADFERLGARAQGAFLLVETHELLDIDGLFREYVEASAIEQRAREAGARGIAWMSSRANDLLYRHNAAPGPKNTLALVTLGREDAARAARLLRAGKRLELTARIEVEAGLPKSAENVIAEIRGSERPEEVVIIGAHLDSWDLGTGALDNGCNVALVIDVARQIQRLGLRPKRTIRFALWNGEEQGLFGSLGYVRSHKAELDKHVMAASFDTGVGRIRGFLTGGREDLIPVVDRALQPVAGLGPFAQVNAAIPGTDHFDFMLEGVPSLVADQESASYGPNYHARSDTFDKIEARQLKLNAAIAGAVAWGFANADAALPRLSGSQVADVVEKTDLKALMQAFDLYDDWVAGRRGRRP